LRRIELGSNGRRPPKKAGRKGCSKILSSKRGGSNRTATTVSVGIYIWENVGGAAEVSSEEVGLKTPRCWGGDRHGEQAGHGERSAKGVVKKAALGLLESNSGRKGGPRLKMRGRRQGGFGLRKKGSCISWAGSGLSDHVKSVSERLRAGMGGHGGGPLIRVS